MRSFLFALKHLLRNAVFPVFLVLTVALPSLAGLAASRALLPPAAVFAEDPDDFDTARLVKCLSEAGFRVAESREDLEYVPLPCHRQGQIQLYKYISFFLFSLSIFIFKKYTGKEGAESTEQQRVQCRRHNPP